MEREKTLGFHADLARGGVICRWDMLDVEGDADNKLGVITFEVLRETLHWSKYPCRKYVWLHSFYWMMLDP